MNSVELAHEDSTFKFPFTDKEDADLQLSRSYDRFRQGLPVQSRKSNEGFSSELGLALSPIARDRESTTSIMEYLEGDTLSLESLESPEIEPNLQQEPTNGKEIATPVTQNLEVTMKQVGQRSNAFIDQMRDAANKRKAAVTRSRDSLVAKEKEQLRSIAECESRFETLKLKLQSAVDLDKENQRFRRNKKHNKGFGGVGVPKVDKKPNTKPMSPKLGLRRNGTKVKAIQKPKELSSGASAFRPVAKSKIMIYNEQDATKEKPSKPRSPEKRNSSRRKSIEVQQIFTKPKPDQPNEASFEEYGGFKARPVPSSTTQRWSAGQLGIPKVAKRATTVPVSPCLGPKRQSRKVGERSEKIIEKQSKSKPKMNFSERSGGSSGSSRSILMSPASAKSSPLLGLDFIHSTRTESTIESDIEPMAQMRTTTFAPIFLRSTARGNRRKEYDIYRVEKHALAIQEKREELQSQIKALHRELKILSKDI